VNAKSVQTTILFADIAGSTRLYENYGDVPAQAVIARCLELLGTACKEQHGQVIKTVGDEIMCRFETADDAVTAARNMQGRMKHQTFDVPEVPEVRIGLHFGHGVASATDVFGEATNVASRVTHAARPRQILTTEQTLQQLSPSLAANARLYDRARLEGLHDELVLYEILWEREDLTNIVARTSFPEQAVYETLRLRRGSEEITVHESDQDFWLGRGSDCRIITPSKLVSRHHARIEYRRGKFVLQDESTNGTFIRTQDGREIYLRREATPLWGHGVISLGRIIQDDDPHLIYYLCD